MVIGSYYVQTSKVTLVPILASIPIAILIALVLFINEFPDHEADRKVKKRTLVVILGKKNAIKIYYIFLSIVYVWIATCVVFNIFPIISLITLITIPLSIKAIAVARKNFNKFRELLPVNGITIILHLTIGLLLSISFIIDGLLII